MSRRVGLVCPYPVDAPGGVQAHVRDLAAALAGAGHRVDVLTTVSGSGSGLRRVARADEDAPLSPLAARAWGLPDGIGLTVVPGAVEVPYAWSTAKVTTGPTARQAVRRWMETTRPEVVHVHEPMAPSLSLMATELAAGTVPVVGTFHTSFKEGHSLRQVVPLLRRQMAPIRAWVAVSHVAAASVRDTFGVLPRVIPTGVRVERFSHPAPRAPWREGPARPTLAFIGRSDQHRKGLRLLLEALPPVVQRTPGLRVFVAGPGQDLARRMVERDFPELRTQVVWLGELSEEDKASLMRSVSLLVAPQVHGENFGITLVEAMAAGAPVLASDLPSFVTVLDGAGVHAPAGDARRLGEALQGLLLDPPARERMRRAGRERAARFDWDVVGREVMGVYEEVLA